MIQNDPNAFEFAGLLPENSEELRRILNEMEEYEKVIIIRQTSGVDCRLAYPLFQKYNVATSRILQSNPYLPYQDE